jgi:hypothetical protein
MDMAETIRQHLRRRTRLSLWLLVLGVGVAFVLMLGVRFAPWAADFAVLIVAGALIGSTALCSFQRCPSCGRWFDRSEYARFTWPFLREPDACTRCGLSYSEPWRKFKKA